MSVSKYLMRRPAILDWNFMERHYPDYYHSDAILKSDDMSYCLGDMGNVPCDTLITEESYKAFEEYAEDLAYRVENGFADFIGSGLTFGQAADYFDDWLYAVAVLEGEGCIQISEAVRLWAEKVFNTPAEKRRQWYAGRLSSDPKPSDTERLLIEVANYIAVWSLVKTANRFWMFPKTSFRLICTVTQSPAFPFSSNPISLACLCSAQAGIFRCRVL